MVGKNDSTTSPITCVAFNKDFSQVALCPNDNSFSIYSLASLTDPCDKWALDHTLVKHDSIVSSLDWSHVTNYIVSCGHDRNAYVWIFDDAEKEWIPTLVILRINRAANFVRWSPNGKKFAVASSAKMVPVCRYEQSNDWWVSKMLKKHKSTVLSVAWHPNSVYLVTGGCDYKMRVYSAYIEELEDLNEDEFGAAFPKQKSFGALLAEIDCSKGWIESVCWSPNRVEGAFVSHNNLITFFSIDAGEEEKIKKQALKIESLPYRAVQFVDESRVLAAGHDNNPHLFEKARDGTWAFKRKIDEEKGRRGPKGKVSAFAKSKALFQSSTMTGRTLEESKQGNDTILKTKHQNQIVDLRVVRDSPGKFFTCGMDGKVLLWNL